MKVDVPFAHAPRSPFSLSVSPATHVDDIADLDVAIEAFARNAMPRNPRIRGASVYDADGVVVVGYLNIHPSDRDRWYGIAAGFEALGRLECVDQLEVACAEITARLRGMP
jgi:hypothetical protein